MEIPEEYFKAGEIARRVREEVRGWLRVGLNLLEIAERVEASIHAKGGEPAFPCNICVDSVAAHYTPTLDDTDLIKEGSLVKVDLGVHVNGFIVDTAVTVSFNPEYDAMVRAAEDVLSEAIKASSKGVKVGEIGRVIASVASRWGYQTIKNLSGHMVEPYTIHAGVSIPNLWVSGTVALKSGQVYAIEPFITTPDGSGVVVESKECRIYSLISRRKTKERGLDDFIAKLWERFKSLPFTPRYFPDMDQSELKMTLEKLCRLKVLRAYPVLVEAKAKPVAQAEDTIAITDDEIIVLTRKS